jgi:hypothetical protein
MDIIPEEAVAADITEEEKEDMNTHGHAIALHQEVLHSHLDWTMEEEEV